MIAVIQSFFDFFTGIYCDYDGAYGDQCFDLANAYSRWIGGQRFTGATADLIFNQPGDFYTQIPNTLDYVPQKGDIVIWNWPHVGIATGNNSDTNQFEVLEQNDPGGSNCHIKLYPNYNGVIGALRPKQLPQEEQAELDQLRSDRDKNWNLYQAEIQTNSQLQQQLTECQSKVVTPTQIPVEVTTNDQSTVVNVSTKEPTVPEEQPKPVSPQLPTQTTEQKKPISKPWRLSDLIVWFLKNTISTLKSHVRKGNS